MIKEHHKFLSWVRLSTDALITSFSWLMSYYIRFEIIGGAQPNLGMFFIKLTPIVILITLYFAYKQGLYSSQRYTSWHRELFLTIIASITAFGAIVLFSYFILNFIISRLTLGIFLVMNTILLVFVRIIIRNIIQNVRRNGKNLRYLLAIGYGDKLDEYLNMISSNSEMGVIVRKIVNPLDYKDFDIIKVLNDVEVDQIVVALPKGNDMLEAAILKSCSNQLIPVVVIADVPYSFIGSKVIDFNGIPIMEFNSPAIGLANRTLKRLLDLFGSTFGLVVLSPLYLVLALMVKLTSKGPIFYGQVRMTREGKVFKMWKFRSMKIGAENIGSGWTVKDDPRRTPIGGFLRATSLDELPQLWNVFRGEMSLVGPRPERPVFIDKFKHEIPAYMLRHKMKAGITGWAQVNGWRGDTSIPKRIECDLYYIKNWSLFLDIKILLLTFVKGFINKNAY